MKILFLSMVVSLLSTSIVRADDAIPDAVVKYFDAETAAREAAIQKAAANVTKLKNAGKAADDLDERKEFVKKIKDAEANLKEQTASTAPRVIMPNKPEQNEVGFVKTVKVVRILGDQQFLAETTTTGSRSVNKGGRDPNSATTKTVEVHAQLVIEGIDTKTLGTDESYKVDRVCQVTGSQKIGDEKIAVATVVDADAWKSEWMKMSSARAKPKPTTKSK